MWKPMTGRYIMVKVSLPYTVLLKPVKAEPSLSHQRPRSSPGRLQRTARELRLLRVGRGTCPSQEKPDFRMMSFMQVKAGTR